MTHKDVVQLSERFRRLELHAAHGGRETLRALMTVLEESQQPSSSKLVQELHENIAFLLPSLPPYAPPLQSINRFLVEVENAQAQGVSVEELKRALARLRMNDTNARAIHEKMAQHLAGFLPDKLKVYTHTLSETVLGVLLKLHEFGRLSLVSVTESRPNNDGWQTARCLAERGLKVHLRIDAAMPEAIECSDVMLSGAEIVNADGSVVGKVGAYTAAVLCQLHQKPLYIIADSTKFNNIPWKDFGHSSISPRAIGIDFSYPSLEVVGTYFDTTPSHFVHAYVTEMGVIQASEIQSILSDRKVSSWLMKQVNN